MSSRLHVYFSGHVQELGFRYAVRTVSLEFDVTGRVKNLPAKVTALPFFMIRMEILGLDWVGE